MLNRNQLVAAVKAFATENNYSLDEIIVTHGGACVLMGHRETTNDIDIIVSKSIWESEHDKGLNPISLGGRVFMISSTDVIDIHIGMTTEKHVNQRTPEGIIYHGLRQTIIDYTKLGRDKDLEVIKSLEDYRDSHTMSSIVNAEGFAIAASIPNVFADKMGSKGFTLKSLADGRVVNCTKE